MNSVQGSSEDSPTPHGRWRFGDFAFDGSTLELSRRGAPVPIEPRPARILGRLLETPGALVRREELRALGWPRLPGAADDSLNTCIAQIRTALGDSAADPIWIETLRGRGYRFIGVVKAIEDGGPLHPGASAPVVRRWHHGWQPVAAVLALFVASGAAVLLSSGRPGPADSGTAAPAQPAIRGGHVTGTELPTRGEPGARGEVASAIAGIDYRADIALDPAGALRLADSAVARFPEDPGVLAARASVLMRLGRVEDAWASTGRALAIDPEHPVGLRVAANLHVLDRAWPEAEAALVRSLDAAPDRSETWVSLAYLQTVRGRFAEADASLRRALELDPLSPVVLGDTGLLRLWAGAYDEALDSCRTAWEVEPRAVWALSCAFDAARLLGDDEQALVWGRRLVAADGELEDVGSILRARVARLESAARDGAGDPWSLSIAYAAVGADDRAAEQLLRAMERPGFGVLGSAVDPRLAEVRRLTAVRRALERMGIAIRA